MAQGQHPVGQRRLRAELRRLREEAGYTQKAVAESMGWSSSKMIRLETGAVSVSPADTRALLDFYDARDPQLKKELLALTQETDGWWEEYRPSCSQQLLNFLGFEDATTRILQFMGAVIPALLQTRDYMRALLSEFRGEKGIDLGVRIGGRRQELLTRLPGPKMSFVLDEAVLHRWVGGRDVMLAQLAHLTKLAMLPHISIGVLPFSAGVHKGLLGSFTVLEFAAEDLVVAFEDPSQAVVAIRDDAEISRGYLDRFRALQKIACTEEDLALTIDRVIERMPG